jgi:hypothetical protein
MESMHLTAISATAAPAMRKRTSFGRLARATWRRQAWHGMLSGFYEFYPLLPTWKICMLIPHHMGRVQADQSMSRDMWCRPPNVSCRHLFPSPRLPDRHCARARSERVHPHQRASGHGWQDPRFATTNTKNVCPFARRVRIQAPLQASRLLTAADSGLNRPRHNYSTE